jgi:hypothetical protein
VIDVTYLGRYHKAELNSSDLEHCLAIVTRSISRVSRTKKTEILLLFFESFGQTASAENRTII